MAAPKSRIALLSFLLAAGVLSIASSAARQPAATPSSSLHWFKGNTHTHTTNSDGDSTPEEVVKWYRDRQYHFLMLTDHNYLTRVEDLNRTHGAANTFLVIAGEEVTMRAGTKPIHVNGLAVRELVAAPTGDSAATLLQRSVDAIRRAGGVPHVNHPNFGWALTVDDIRVVERTRLLEIFSGHPLVNNLGGGGAPSVEEMWDRILSSGRLMYGLAVDDAHHFKRPNDAMAVAPGRGWIYVRAAQLAVRDIVDAIDRGDFYASTGVELSSYQADPQSISVSVKAEPSSRYRVQFIGRNGRLLEEQTTPSATYTIKGDEGYVRGKVLESNGRVAWTQPYPIGQNAPR